MDSKTQRFYSENSEQLFKKYNSCSGGISDYFLKAFNKGMTILDIGCGSGRDIRTLHEMGFDADGIDPCDEFVEYAKLHNTGYGSIITKAALPNLEPIGDKKYDGILCSAVLMHLPEEQLFDASFAIRGILKEHGYQADNGNTNGF